MPGRFEDVSGRTRRGALSWLEAAEALGVSGRTFRRWRDRCEEEGAEGLYDHRLGRVSSRRAAVDEATRVLPLFDTRSRDVTAQRFHEKLVSEHDVRRSCNRLRPTSQAHGRARAAPRRGARRLASRLPGVEVVAEIDRLQPRQRRPQARQPAERRAALAVLLHGAVLRAHELGRQRRRPPLARSHNRRPDEAVEILHRPVAATRRTLRAMNLPRMKVLQTIQCNQAPIIQAAQRRQAARRARIIDDMREYLIEMPRRRAVQHPPDVIVARNPRHPEQGLRVRTLPRRRQQPPMRQKRRALHDKRRKRHQTDIAHPIARVAARPLVRQRRAPIRQHANIP